MTSLTSNAANRAVRAVAVDAFYSTERPSGTFSFGATTMGDLTLTHVRVRVADRAGNTAEGWGAIFFSHGWAFPGTALDGAAKDAAMRALLEETGAWLAASGLYGHPLDHFLTVEPRLATATTGDVVIPTLAALNAWAAADAAIHDAYGKLHGVSAYAALGPEYVGWDLGWLLGSDFRGRYLPEFFRAEPVTSLPISHTVGAADPLTADEQTGVYPALAKWIARDGVFSFKVKLKGQDLEWDITRLLRVYDIARTHAQARREVRIFGDLNEQGPSLDYIAALLDGVAQRSPETFAALDALEQPASRNLSAGAPDLSTVAARVPIVLDEGLTSLAAIDQAVALGWNGIALKTCKTQSLMLLALAKAAVLGLQVSVQDLTNPAIALVQSLGLAARLPHTAPIESNQRQFFPDTSAPEAAAWPTAFTVHAGRVSIDTTGPGLAYGDLCRIARPIFHTD